MRCLTTSLIQMEMEQKLNISEIKLKKWMLMMKKLLTTCNSSIVDGLIQWKTSIDKELEGVEVGVGLTILRSVLFVTISCTSRLELFQRWDARTATRSSIRHVLKNGSRPLPKTSALCASLSFSNPSSNLLAS